MDVVHFGGHGFDALIALEVNADNTQIAASGHFFGNLTFTGLPTMYSSNTDATNTNRDGWMAMFDASIVPIWTKRWPESTTLTSDMHSTTWDVAFDATSLFGVGEQCGEPCVGAMSKMAISDNVPAWEKVFTDVQSFERITTSNDGSGDILVRGKLYTTDGKVTAANPTPFGVSCEADYCGLVARMTNDGAVVWARTIKGASNIEGPIGYATIKSSLELDATGAPYLYVAMKGASNFGPVSLDAETPYAGCKDDTTGVVTPAYEIDTTKMVTAADCPAGSNFVGTDSADAVWAVSAQTGAYCTKKQGNIIFARGEGGDCLVKYHAFTGLPVWAVVLPDVTAIAPTPDGALHATGSSEGLTFGAIQTPATCNFECERIWHAIIDGTTGVGLSVQSYGSIEPATTNPYDMTLTSDGDVCLLAYAAGTSIRFDDNFTMTWPEKKRADGFIHGQVALFKVATSGTKVKPSCISTCTSDESTTVIEANSCYIDGICYADGDGVPEFSLQYTDGQLCRICDVTQSQTSWSDDLMIVGVSECFIDGVCYKGNYSGVDADWYSYIPEASSANLPGGGGASQLDMPVLRSNQGQERVVHRGRLRSRPWNESVKRLPT